MSGASGADRAGDRGALPVGVRLGQGGALVRAALCAGGAALMVALEGSRVVRLHLPFQAALHERWLPLVLAGLAAFFLLLGAGKVRPRIGFLVGVLEGALGLAHIAILAGVTGDLAPLRLAWTVATALTTLAMLAGFLAARRAALRPLPLSGALAALALLYVAVGCGFYPLTYATCLVRGYGYDLDELSPAPPFERPSRVIGGARHEAYYGELHGHSYISIDARIHGAASPVDYYRFARDIAGLDFCALTEHDSPDGVYEHPEYWRMVCGITDRFNEPGRFVTFKAYEWTSGGGHHELLRHLTGGDRFAYQEGKAIWGHRNVLFPGDEVPEVPFCHADPGCDTPEELWEKMRPYGAIAIPHHPLGGPVPALRWERYDPALEPLVEIYSAHGNSEAMGSRLQIYNAYTKDPASSDHSVRHAMKAGHRFGLIGSTDSHTGWGGNATTREEPGYARHEGMIEFVRGIYGGEEVKGGGLVGVFATSLTRAGIWDALTSRRTFATSGPRMVAVIEAEGAFMGQTASARAGGAVRLSVSALGTQPLTALELVRDGELVHSFAPAGGVRFDGAWSERAPAAGEHAYYLRVVQDDRHMAWSSPVWVQVVP